MAHRPLHRKQRRNRLPIVVGALLVIAAIAYVAVAELTPTNSNAPRHATAPPTTRPHATSTTAGQRKTNHSSSTSSSSTSTTTSTTTTTTIAIAAAAPDDVLVEVLNGSGAANIATQTAAALKAIGFHINGTGDETSFDYPTSIVAYDPGSEAYAQSVANHVEGATRLVVDSSVPASNEVLFIVGNDFRGVSPS